MSRRSDEGTLVEDDNALIGIAPSGTSESPAGADERSTVNPTPLIASTKLDTSWNDWHVPLTSVTRRATTLVPACRSAEISSANGGLSAGSLSVRTSVPFT